VGKQWDEAEIEPVMAAILEQFKRHIETKVRVISDMQKKGEISFFQEPVKPASSTPKAESDGS